MLTWRTNWKLNVFIENYVNDIDLPAMLVLTREVIYVVICCQGHFLIVGWDLGRSWPLIIASGTRAWFSNFKRNWVFWSAHNWTEIQSGKELNSHFIFPSFSYMSHKWPFILSYHMKPNYFLSNKKIDRRSENNLIRLFVSKPCVHLILVWLEIAIS